MFCHSLYWYTVYDYLMSSLRLSTHYFSGCGDMPYATLDEPVVLESGSKQGEKCTFLQCSERCQD